MSFIENLLKTSVVAVPCQTDPEYKFASNQCSWCAGLFAIKYRELKDAYINDKNKFLEIYKSCLEQGTEMRKKFGVPVYGENIDNPTLNKELKLSKNIFLEATFELNEEKSDEFLSILPDDLKNEFNTRRYLKITDFSVLSTYKFILISRHGQSFTLITLGNEFLVLDSHVHTVGTMTRENAYKYIKYQNTELPVSSYLYVTILCGA
jgi:hypothetical protein